MKSLTKFENPSCYPLQETCSGFPKAACDSKVVPKTGHECSGTLEKNCLMKEKECRNKFDAAFRAIFRIGKCF